MFAVEPAITSTSFEDCIGQQFIPCDGASLPAALEQAYKELNLKHTKALLTALLLAPLTAPRADDSAKDEAET